MRKSIILLFCILIPISLHAQKWMKKARKAQVSVIAYDKQDNMKESQGFYIDESGIVLTDYDVMKGAVKALVIDAKGKEYPVQVILGGNSMYNIIKLGLKLEKCPYLEIAHESPKEQDIVYILPNARAEKTNACTNDTIIKDETFLETYHYFTLNNAHNERLISSPVMNKDGKLVGVLQPSTDGKNKSFVLDSHYGDSLRIRPMDAGNMDLKSILIRKELPEKEEDAASYLYLLGQRDSSIFLPYVDEFITRYPDSSTGYILKAEALSTYGQYAEADSTYRQGLSRSSAKVDEIHFSWSKILYALNMRTTYKKYNDWDLEKALAEGEQAFASNPLPIYTNQIGSCLYALKRYDEACKKFIELSHTDMRSPQVFLYAAQCKQMSKADISEIIALQDSAVSCYPQPYPSAAANTFLMRGTSRAQAGLYREAVADYNQYEHLVASQVTPNFYYEREQMEMKCKMFPNALNDIERAIKMAPKEPLYYAELAAVNYRVGQLDEAIAAAEDAIRLDEEFADAYRILGVCLRDKNQTAQAKEKLQKAVDLGDTLASDILKEIK